MFLLLPLVVASQNCKPTTCQDSTSLKCISLAGTENSTSLLLSECPSEFPYCPFTDLTFNSTCITMGKTSQSTAYPGDPCDTNRTCVYSDCVDKVCQGVPSSVACNETGQCTPGYRCDQNYCKSLLFIGYNTGNRIMNCTTDYECVNNGVCDEGNCYKYYSKGEGLPVGNCINGTSLICESGICYNGICISKLAKSIKSTPMPCQNNNDCVSDYYNSPPNQFNLYSQCQCGLNKDGLAYCTQFPGDDIQSKYLKIAKEWTESDAIFKCHSFSRFKLDCIKKYWSDSKYKEYAYYSMYAANYPQIQGNQECVKNMLLSEFYIAQEEYQSSRGLVLGFLGSLFYIIYGF